MSKKSALNSQAAPPLTEWGASPPIERTWRDLLADALDNFSSGGKSRENSPERSSSKNQSNTNAKGGKSKPLGRKAPSLNGVGGGTPVTSPTAGLGGSGWLLSSTRANERGFEPTDDTDASSGPIPGQHRNEPVMEDSEHVASENERSALRAQMSNILGAVTTYHPGMLVPSLPKPKPRSPASPFTEVEGEDFFAQECEQCAAVGASSGASGKASNPCPWATLPTESLLAHAKQHLWTEEGLPAAHRASIWAAALGVSTQMQKHAWQTYYSALLGHVVTVARAEEHAQAPATKPSPPPLASHTDSPVLGPASISLVPLPSSAAAPSLPPRGAFHLVAFREVLKDVERTLPGISMFAPAEAGKDTSGGPVSSSIHASTSSSSKGQSALKRMLLAFSLHRPLIGYCQSMSFLAAEVLLVFQGQDESLAFGVLCTLLERRLSYYTKSMLGCVLDARVLRDLLSFHDPDVATLLSKHSVSVEHFAASWLLCAFVGSPLTLGHATRVWDGIVLVDCASPTAGVMNEDSVLLATGLSLLQVHRQSFLSISRPTPEQLMNVLTKLVGQTTSLTTLLNTLKERLGNKSFIPSLRSLRTHHRSLISTEHATLSPSRLRRLERATGVQGEELKHLWNIFLSSAPLERRWDVLVSGVINDLLHFRLALGEAVFPLNPPLSSNDRSGTGEEDDLFSSPEHTPISEQLRWKAGGVISSCMGTSGEEDSESKRCLVCLPTLFASPSPSTPSSSLQSCPKCSWAVGVCIPVAKSAPKSWIEKSGALARPCTCVCSCGERGLNSALAVTFGTDGSSSHSRSSSFSGPSATTPPSILPTASVFQRLFHFFDSMCSPHGARGFLDFESFVKSVKFFSLSRVERLQSVFRLAGGRENEEDILASVSTSTPISASDSTIQRGRIRRDQFEAFVAAFEELYHGSTIVTIHARASLSSSGTVPAGLTAGPSPSPSPSPSPPPPLRLSSSVAAARMFVSMSFEKERAGKARTIAQQHDPFTNDVEDDIDASDHSMPAPTNLHSIPASPDDSLSYESFASFILLHPLVAGFFRLDTIAD